MDKKISSLFEGDFEENNSSEDIKIEKKQLDLAKTLLAFDMKDRDYFINLSEEEKKLFVPYVLMRYSSSANNPDNSLIMTNEFINKNYSEIYKHPELVYLLFTVVGQNRKLFHKWIPPGKKKKANSKLEELIQKLYPFANSYEIELLIKQSSKEEITKLGKDFGLSDHEIKELVK